MTTTSADLALRDALATAVSTGGPLWPWADSLSFAVDLSDLAADPAAFDDLTATDLAERYLATRGMLVVVVDETTHRLGADELLTELQGEPIDAMTVAAAIRRLVPTQE